MIVDKIVRTDDVLDDEGNVIGQNRVVFYKISKEVEAEDVNGNPVTIKQHYQTVSKQALFQRRDALLAKRAKINEQLQELVDSYNIIRNSLGDE